MVCITSCARCTFLSQMLQRFELNSLYFEGELTAFSQHFLPNWSDSVGMMLMLCLNEHLMALENLFSLCANFFKMTLFYASHFDHFSIHINCKTCKCCSRYWYTKGPFTRAKNWNGSDQFLRVNDTVYV